jgi:HK97 family phage prohead protease
MIIQKIGEVEIKNVDAEQGVVEAFVNTMGVKDKDGDIIEPTAFDKSIATNLPIPVLSGHDQHQIVGKVIEAEPVQTGENVYRLFATMQMNMDTQAGREAFSNIKGEFVREWSVGFNLPEGGMVQENRGRDSTRRISELDWVETSAVVRGASPETATISAKQEKANRAISSHSTETTSGQWSGSVSRAGITNGAEGLRAAYAWVNPQGDPNAKGSYKFIHHHVENGTVGAANIRACSGAIGVLNGGRGGTSIPKGDREKVYKHLAKHIKDAGKEPPELISRSRVWSRVRNIETAYWKELVDDLSEDEATALQVALLEQEEETPTDANDETTEDAAIEVDDNADDDVDETFDADAAESELLVNAERQLALLSALLENRLAIQEEDSFGH